MPEPAANDDRPAGRHPRPELDNHDLAVADVDPADLPDVVPPVPINVWRVTDLARPKATPGSPATQLAVLLLGVFTRPNDIAVAVADVALPGAARGGARRYQQAPPDPAHLTDVTDVAGAARLIILRWPPPAPAATHPPETNPEALALTPSEAGQPYVEHAQGLLQAAQQAGLAYAQHIVVGAAPISAPVREDEVEAGLNLLVFARRRTA